MAALGGLWLVLVAALVYDVSRPDSILGVVVAFAVGALGFIAVGFLLAAVLPSARAAQAVGLTIFFPMWLLAGSGPPRSLFSTALRRVGDALPLTHVVTALQDPWLGFGWNWGELLLLIGLLVVAAAASARLFRWE